MTRGRRRSALETKRRHGHLPSIVQAADDIVLGTPRIGEEDLVELRRRVDLPNRTHLDAGLVHRHQHVGDAGVQRRFRISTSQQEAIVRVLSLSRPDLLTVDDPLFAIQFRLALKRREIRPRSRLAEPLTPRRRTLENPRQELLFLFLGAPPKNRRADERVAEEVAPHRGVGSVELFGDDHALHRRQPLATVLLGPRRTDPAALEQLRRPFLVELFAIFTRQGEVVIALTISREPALRQVLRQPCSNIGAERFGLWGICQVHG